MSGIVVKVSGAGGCAAAVLESSLGFTMLGLNRRLQVLRVTTCLNLIPSFSAQNLLNYQFRCQSAVTSCLYSLSMNPT